MRTDRGTDPRVERARQAVAVVFALNGIGMASWLSRTPAIRDLLDLSPSGLGLLLVCLSVGAVAALPSSGPVVHRIGPRRTVVAGMTLEVVGLVGLAVGLESGRVAVAGVSMFLLGVGTSSWDVAMNVEGADVEQRLGRTLMPRFHAGFSLGTVGGALLGAGCAAVGIGAPTQFVGTAVLLTGGVLLAVRAFLPVVTEDADGAQRSGTLTAWREPRTLLVGLLVLAFAFTEGTANDWLAVALVDGLGTSETVGALGFGAFVTAMTIGRLLGGTALERYGRVPVLRGTALLALAGTLLVITGSTALAVVGAVVWGLGASLGFPVGMSAAADEPARSAARVSVVASIGYTAFIAGPVVVGFLADEVGIRPALLVVPVAVLIGAVAATATRPPASAARTVSAA